MGNLLKEDTFKEAMIFTLTFFYNVYYVDVYTINNEDENLYSVSIHV